MRPTFFSAFLFFVFEGLIACTALASFLQVYSSVSLCLQTAKSHIIPGKTREFCSCWALCPDLLLSFVVLYPLLACVAALVLIAWCITDISVCITCSFLCYVGCSFLSLAIHGNICRSVGPSALYSIAPAVHIWLVIFLVDSVYISAELETTQDQSELYHAHGRCCMNIGSNWQIFFQFIAQWPAQLRSPIPDPWHVMCESCHVYS
jgi:hypothetical protein